MSRRLPWLALSLSLCACGARPDLQDQPLDPEVEGVDEDPVDSGWDEPVAEAPWTDLSVGDADDPDDDDGWEPPFDPWSLGVVVSGDLGSPDEPYQSDFEGAAAVGGSAWMAWFSLNDVCGEPVPFSLFADGTVNVTGAVNNGGVEAGGDITMTGASVDGSVVGGGDLMSGSGHIAGDLSLGGVNQAGGTVSVAGQTQEHCPYSPVLDLDALEDFFGQASAAVDELIPTCEASERYGELTLELADGVNVVELDAEDLEDAWGVTIRGPADAELYINVRTDSLALDGMVWTYDGGISPTATMLNLPETQQLEISQGDHHVNILAPAAAVSFPSGLVTGNLVAASLSGGGQVNCGHFDGGLGR